ncbi:MAG: phosphoribosylaminoimidazolesuccinocarboxamide synthase, partial [Candidatus Cloacimonetes bacterium]|nr:phosphoribosylaminoimidazolesuccinocarboxamide synthase [Candidatus Cloacimonadota bacterium]
DKQYIRDFLSESGWNKQPPAPALPEEVIAKTREKYLSIYKIITGKEI